MAKVFGMNREGGKPGAGKTPKVGEYATAEEFMKKRDMRLRDADERRNKVASTSAGSVGAGAAVLDALIESQNCLSSDMPKKARSRQLRLHAWLLELATLREELVNRVRETDRVKLELAERKALEEKRLIVAMQRRIDAATGDLDAVGIGALEASLDVEKGAENIAKVLRMGWRHLQEPEMAQRLEGLEVEVSRLIRKRALLEHPVPKPSATDIAYILSGKMVPNSTEAHAQKKKEHAEIQIESMRDLYNEKLAKAEDEVRRVKHNLNNRRPDPKWIEDVSNISKQPYEADVDVSRLSEEYQRSLRNIKTAHDRSIKQMEKKYKKDLEKVSRKAVENLKREVTAHENATFRLLQRLGVSGDAIAAYVETNQSHGLHHQVNAQPDFWAGKVAAERRERATVEAKLAVAEEEASTSRDYALFKQRQQYDMKLEEMQGVFEDKISRVTSECATARELAADAEKGLQTLIPLQERLDSLYREMDIVEPNEGAETSTNQNDHGASTSIQATAEGILRKMNFLEADVKRKVESASLSKERAITLAAAHFAGELGSEKERMEDHCHDRLLKREKQHDEIIAELRMLEQKNCSPEKGPNEGVDFAEYNSDDVPLSLSSSSGLGHSDDEESPFQDEDQSIPPEPRTWLPKATRAHRAPQPRSSKGLHPGIERLLKNGQRLGFKGI